MPVMSLRRIPVFLLSLALSWLPRAARAAEPPRPRAISLPDAIAYARAHQPAVQAAERRVAERMAEARVPRAQWLPTVGIGAELFAATSNNTTASYLGVGVLDLPRVGGSRVTDGGSFQPYASTVAAVGVTQELFDFGRIAAQSAAADALVEVEKQSGRAADLDVTFQVEEAYFAVLAAKSIVKAAGDAYERARVHRDLAKAGVASGLRPPIELTRAEADLARFDIGRVRAGGALQTAQTLLAAAVGSDEAALDAAGAPTAPPDIPTLEAAIREASSRDPLLLRALAAVRAQEAETRAIGALRRPDLSATATFSGRAGGAPPSGNGAPATDDGWVPNVPNWDAAVIFTWPLFDGTIDARVRASRAMEDARRAEVSVQRQRETTAVRQAYVTVQVSRAALPGLRRAVDAARANYAQADARFKAGLGTSTELADAEALRTDADIQYAMGQFDVARARAAFARAIAEGLQ